MGIEEIEAKIDKNRFCILNMDGLFSMDPKLLGKSNTKNAQEVQREQCKGKTIVEILNNEWRKK